jgi:hypothetical protein
MRAIAKPFRHDTRRFEPFSNIVGRVIDGGSNFMETWTKPSRPHFDQGRFCLAENPRDFVFGNELDPEHGDGFGLERFGHSTKMYEINCLYNRKNIIINCFPWNNQFPRITRDFLPAFGNGQEGVSFKVLVPSPPRIFQSLVPPMIPFPRHGRRSHARGHGRRSSRRVQIKVKSATGMLTEVE